MRSLWRRFMAWWNAEDVIDSEAWMDVLGRKCGTFETITGADLQELQARLDKTYRTTVPLEEWQRGVRPKKGDS